MVRKPNFKYPIEKLYRPTEIRNISTVHNPGKSLHSISLILLRAGCTPFVVFSVSQYCQECLLSSSAQIYRSLDDAFNVELSFGARF